MKRFLQRTILLATALLVVPHIARAAQVGDPSGGSAVASPQPRTAEFEAAVPRLLAAAPAKFASIRGPVREATADGARFYDTSITIAGMTDCHVLANELRVAYVCNVDSATAATGEAAYALWSRRFRNVAAALSATPSANDTATHRELRFTTPSARMRLTYSAITYSITLWITPN